MNCTEYVVYSSAHTADHRRKFELVAEWSRDEYISYAPVFVNAAHGFNMRHFRVGTNIVSSFPLICFTIDFSH